MADAASDERGYWNATAPAADFPRLSGRLEVDVAIVGGGIVGVSAARFLKDRGLTVAVVEARRVGRQVTGMSTAKVSAQHGLLYQELERKHGEEKARLYAEAQQWAVARIAELARTHGIAADIEPMPAYVWAEDEADLEPLEAEVAVARRLGLPARLERGDVGLPFPVLAAMRSDDQAQFHPVKYVAGLAATIPGEGSHVFEGSRVIDHSPTGVATASGSVAARHVVMATHLPLGGIGLFYAIAAPRAETVIAAPVGRALPGMYKNAGQPGRSIRTHRCAGRTFAIAAGAGFKPGHADEEQERLRELETWLARHFDAGPVEHRWVNEDYGSIDGAPFVGWSSGRGEAYLVATGFQAWGISNGTAAAAIIADLATGRDNPWLPAFDARRIRPVAGAAQFAAQNLEVAAHLVSGYLSRKPKSFGELAPGEAAILKVDGENVAGFRDEQGRVHAVSAVCTHMGCLVGWNATDRTWDCPCHGSRFALDGEVLHGPAVEPLGSKPAG